MLEIFENIVYSKLTGGEPNKRILNCYSFLDNCYQKPMLYNTDVFHNNRLIYHFDDIEGRFFISNHCVDNVMFNLNYSKTKAIDLIMYFIVERYSLPENTQFIGSLRC